MAQFAPSALKTLFAGLNCPISFYSKLINSFTRHGHRRAQFTPPAALVARWCGWPCGRRAGGGWCKYQHTTQAARRPCWPCLALPLGWRAGVGGVSCLAGRLRGVSLRFRCAGGIITPAAPVALDIRPFPCLVSVTYISTSAPPLWRWPCFGCLAVCPSLRCVCVACWPRPSVSTYGGGILSRAAGVARVSL